MKRILSAVLLVLVAVGSARAQGTVMPIPLAQWFDNTGLVLTDGGLCVFVAGTSTAATTYTTAALSVANANPIRFSSAGRPTSGGVFLTPGSSYKFLLKDFTGVTSPTCIPDTGVTLWSVDNVTAVPGSAAAVDITGTAGESIAAGDAVYMSKSGASTSAGQWYRADADSVETSTNAFMVGVSPFAVASGSQGSFRIAGQVTVTGPLTTGAAYYISTAVGGITATPPTNSFRLGEAQSSTVIVLGNMRAPVSPRGPPQGRLTLTTGTPVTTADVTAATTIFYTPYTGNQIDLFDGTAWGTFAFAQVSIAVPATTSQMYDIWGYINSSGVFALEALAWTNDTTRATALVAQDGALVKTGATTRRYLGSFRTTTVSGQTEDSFTKRFLWNYYNRVPRELKMADANATWSYNTATVRQVEATAANRVEFVIGVAEVAVAAWYSAVASNDNAAIQPLQIGVGLDSTTVYATNTQNQSMITSGANLQLSGIAHAEIYPAVGYHALNMLERGSGTGTTTWFGTGTYPGAGTLLARVDGW